MLFYLVDLMRMSGLICTMVAATELSMPGAVGTSGALQVHVKFLKNSSETDALQKKVSIS